MDKSRIEYEYRALRRMMVEYLRVSEETDKEPCPEVRKWLIEQQQQILGQIQRKIEELS